MSHNSALPQDICNIIIDRLCDDRSSLEVCSLVASTWRAASQKHLHRTMVFLTSLPHPSPPRAQDTGMSAPGQASILNKTRLLLDTSSHLLRYARSVIIRGECMVTIQARSIILYKPTATRAPDPSLVILLGKIRTLALPSLIASVELRDLRWTAIDTNLQFALISLISAGFIKDVTLYGCDIPCGVPCLRFVGPQTRSLTLNRVSILQGDPSVSLEPSIEAIPISSAPYLISLIIIEDSFKRSLNTWILHGAPSSTSQTTALCDDSWHNNVNTLSLCRNVGARALFELLHTFRGLTTLKLKLPDTSLSLYQVLCIPTLEYLHLLLLPSHSIIWLTNSFRPSNAQFLSPYPTFPTKPKTIYIDVLVELSCTLDMPPHVPLPDLLCDIRVFDDVVASIPNVECYLTTTVSSVRVKDGPERIEYEETKKNLVDFQANLRALRLQVY